MATILIIEDEIQLGQLYWLALTQDGHEIRLADTGEDGVDQEFNLGIPCIAGCRG